MIELSNCSVANIKENQEKQGKVYLPMFLDLIYTGNVPSPVGRQRKDFKEVGTLWLSFKKFVDSRNDKPYRPCYEFLSKYFREKMRKNEADQDAVDRFAITTWFQVQQYNEDQCEERKRILRDMLSSIPEGFDRTVAEIVFLSKMATTLEFENDLECAKDVASKAKYLSEICYDKTAKILAHYSYFFLHRRLYLREKNEFNHQRALEQCTIGCDMFPIPDEDGDFEMYCALLFLLYKAGDYLHITYEFEVLDSDFITIATISAAEKVLRSAHKYLATATPRKRLSYTYCMTRLHHLKLEFETASEYLQETQTRMSYGILDNKEMKYVSDYCKRFEEEFSCQCKVNLSTVKLTRLDYTVMDKASTVEAREFLLGRLLHHYQQMPEIVTLNDALQGVKGKLSIQLLPNFEQLDKPKSSCRPDEKICHSLASWGKYLFSDPDERKLITVTGKTEVVKKTFIDILKTWIDSVGYAATSRPDYTNHENYDLVLHFEYSPDQTYCEEFDNYVCHNLSTKLGLSDKECRNGLSNSRRILVLLENVTPSSLPTIEAESPYSVICAINEETELRKHFVTQGNRKVNIDLKDGYVFTREDGHELEKWINSYLADRSSSEACHSVCFANIKAGNETVKVALTEAAHVEVVEISNSHCSFVVAHEAHTLLLRGQSILTLDKVLTGSHKLHTLYLCFEREHEDWETCHTFDEFITKEIIASVDKCRHLQCIKLRNLSIGKHSNINQCVERSMIDKVKNNRNIKTTRNACSALFGPYLHKFDFEKSDFDSERSVFVKAIILDAICHKIVTSNEEIIEADVCEERQDRTSKLSIVCYTKANSCSTQVQEYTGFPVLYKPHDLVSTESVKAEAEQNDIKYDYNDHQEVLTRTVRSNIDNLFRKHSNLEAVCGSLVRSRKDGIEKSVPCIVLYCRWKGMVPYGEREFPKVLKDPSSKHSFLTDIREGYFVLGPNGTSLTEGAKDWKQELAMGCSIGPKEGNFSATLGPFLNIDGTDTTCFLTVRHMFQPLSIDDLRLRGTKVVQPSEGDILVGSHGASGSCSVEERLCGEVLMSHFDNKVDAAVIKISPDRMPKRGNFVSVTKDAVSFAGFSESNFPTFDQGIMVDATKFTVSDHASERVIKFGKETGLTKGTLDLNEMAVQVKDESMLSIYYNGKMHKKVMKQQLKINSYAVNPFFKCGDSGSAVFLVDKDNKLHCIGMAIGILTDYACVVTPIKTILETLSKKSPHGEKFELKKFELEQMDS